MATHSSFLAWRIPRIEDPGGLAQLKHLSTHVPPRPDTWCRAPHLGDERASCLVSTVKSCTGSRMKLSPIPSWQALSLAPAGWQVLSTCCHDLLLASHTGPFQVHSFQGGHPVPTLSSSVFITLVSPATGSKRNQKSRGAPC